MSRSRRIFGLDAGLLLGALALVAASLYLLATGIVRPEGGVDQSFAHRQAAFALIGVGILVVVSHLPVSAWSRFGHYAWWAALVSIASVAVIGTVVNGARRWIALGPVNLQPSETGKVLVLLAVAAFLAHRSREIREGRVFVLTLGMCAVPAALVFVQPDFGTAQVFGYLSLGLLFFAGARAVHFAMLGGAVVAAAVLVLAVLPAIGIEVLHDYQTSRLTGFLNPEADPQGTNYQTIQAKVAIGSGQLTGRPDSEASQVQQGFLPEPQTDFIFATLSERHGFVGGALLLGLYLFVISRMLYAVGIAPTPYARLIAGGVATLFFAQVTINVGMVVGVLPVTGVPLPLFSYGGSALWTNMAAVGLVLAVLREAESPHVRYERRTGRPAGGFASLRGSGDRSRRAGVGSGRTRGASLLASSFSTSRRNRRRRIRSKLR